VKLGKPRRLGRILERRRTGSGAIRNLLGRDKGKELFQRNVSFPLS
jgi:hypothetical protein